MKIAIQSGKELASGLALVVVPVYRGPDGKARVDRKWSSLVPKAIRAVLDSGDLSGARGARHMSYPPGAKPAPRVLFLGMGDPQTVDGPAFSRFGATAAAHARKIDGRKAALLLPTQSKKVKSDAERCRWLAEGLTAGAYSFEDYLKTSAKKRAGGAAAKSRIAQWIVQVPEADSVAPMRRDSKAGAAIGAGVNLARQVGNLPANALGPVELAAHARREGRAAGLKVSVLDEGALAKQGMGALLGVAQGSKRPARMIVLEHRPPRATGKPLVFVGKAITFDTGGISLKPPARMEEMKFDMCGGAAVLGGLVSIGHLGLRRRVIGIISAAENMPSGDAYRPSDIVESAAGLTIEVINTDAEGRLALADALHYAKRYDPELVVDLATLTGAVVVALGHSYTGLFAPDAKVAERIRNHASQAGEKMWPLPVEEEYADLMKSRVADLKNSGGRWGGACSAAAFLERFTDYPWAHLDIAGTSHNCKFNNGSSDPGATGVGVRTLVRLAQDW